jgi:hypothetical protein
MIKHLLFSLMLVLSITMTHASFVEDDGDDEGPQRKPIYHIYNDIDLISQTNISYAKPRIILRAIYPELQKSNESGDIDQNNSVQNFNAAVTNLIKEEAAIYKTKVQEHQPYQSTLAKADIKNDLNIDYDASVVNVNKHRLISVRFSIQGYISGTEHPYHYHRVLNYDLDTDEKIELADLFKLDSDYLNILSEYARKGLSRKLSNKEMMRTGTEPTIENFKNWNLKPDGLLITFDEYKVAPYVEGTQIVNIPYSALKKYVSTETPLGNCLQHKSKCVRYNLLTGGFVDQAVNTKHRRFYPILSQR